jgi:hypothetical protein
MKYNKPTLSSNDKKKPPVTANFSPPPVGDGTKNGKKLAAANGKK